MAHLDKLLDEPHIGLNQQISIVLELERLFRLVYLFLELKPRLLSCIHQILIGLPLVFEVDIDDLVQLLIYFVYTFGREITLLNHCLQQEVSVSIAED